MKNKGLKILLIATALFLTGCGGTTGSSESSSISESTSEVSYNNLISISEALTLAEQAGSNGTNEKYTVIGTIVDTPNSQYGDLTITDGTNQLFVYGPRGADGKTYFDQLADKPGKGDTVVLYGTLKNYEGTLEMDHPAIISFEKGENVEPEFDINDYTQKTISEVRMVANETKVIVSGIVSKFTYANGGAKDGFFLVDDNASIYVYGKDVSSQVKEGSTVKIAGTKDYYVLDKEVTHAQKWGYKGANQISDAYLIETDGKTDGVWNKSWVEEKTIKEIMDTPITEDISSNIYKVTCVVNKVVDPSGSFTNYYFNDLDNVTGSYTYTKWNGKDFSWLDEFDGKICTAYLSPLNAKSQPEGCVWRFSPVAVEENSSYQFDMSTAPEFTWEYYIEDQFISSYYVDPNMELITSINNNVVNFDSTISYSSLNEDVAYFETTDGVTTFHLKDVGKATITVSIESGDFSTTKTVDVELLEIPEYTAMPVETILTQEDASEVTVEGIVIASVVNKTAFYIQDDTGVIAVLTDKATVSALSVGDKVVFNGTFTNSASQIQIKDASLVINFYGNHDYSSDNYVTGKTVQDLKSESNTATVYVIEGKLIKQTAQYGTYVSNTYHLTDDTGATMLLYNSSINQYSAFANILNQEGTFEVALCDWNDKGYKICILSAEVNGVKIINTLNFEN